MRRQRTVHIIFAVLILTFINYDLFFVHARHATPGKGTDAEASATTQAEGRTRGTAPGADAVTGATSIDPVAAGSPSPDGATSATPAAGEPGANLPAPDATTGATPAPAPSPSPSPAPDTTTGPTPQPAPSPSPSPAPEPDTTTGPTPQPSPSPSPSEELDEPDLPDEPEELDEEDRENDSAALNTRPLFILAGLAMKALTGQTQAAGLKPVADAAWRVVAGAVSEGARSAGDGVRFSMR